MTETVRGRSDRLDNLLDDAPDVTDRPALAKLSADQLSLLDQWLKGFTSRRAVLDWMQEAAMQSLGALEDDWFVAQVTDATVMASLLEEPWGPLERDVSSAWAADYRADVAAKDLIGAFHDATNQFRWSASERHDRDEYDGDETDLDAQAPGMRPAFEDVDKQQDWALARLLDGFEDAEQFLLWGQYVTRASYAEIDRSTVREAYFDRVVRDWMTSPVDEQARFWRETWAAKFVLPGFNRAAARISSRSSEVVQAGENEMQVPR